MVTDDDSVVPSNFSTTQLVVGLGVAVALIMFGSGLAMWATTSGGAVSIETTTIETESGSELSATIYEPRNASADEPAPAVLLFHGYTGSKNDMSNFATEFANRGYVAVSVDQPGHGASDPPAFQNRWGGPASLEYTQSLDYVDADRIAMIGHSMGGFAALAAAEEHPEGYVSLVLLGSTWAPMGDIQQLPEANETFPRNMAVIFSPYDEYGQQMWNVSAPAEVANSEKLAAAFGTAPPVQPRLTYGDLNAGTARVFTSPRSLHTRMSMSTPAIADTIAWVFETTDNPQDPTTENQRWHWAKIGQVLSLIGVIGIAIGATVLSWRQFEGRFLDSRTEPNGGTQSTKSNSSPHTFPLGRNAFILTILPVVTIYVFYPIGTLAVPTTRVTPMELIHGYVLWGIATGLIGWRISGTHDRNFITQIRTALSDTPHFRPILTRIAAHSKPIVFATLAGLVGVGTVYAIVWMGEFVPGSGFRAWKVGLSPLTVDRWVSLLIYVVPILCSTIFLSYGVDRVLNVRRIRDILSSVLVLTGGMMAVLIMQYAVLFMGHGLPAEILGPFAIQVMRGVLLLTVSTVIVTSSRILTSSPLPGGICAGLFVTWMLVTTQPLHVIIF